MAAPAAEVEAEAAAGTAYVPEDDDLDSTEEEDEEELEEEEEESDEEKKPEPAPIQPPTDNGERKRQRIEIAEKKPAAIADDSRRLFQRLFSDEDEIAILQGFLDFNSQRSGHHHHHHDTAPFYEQIKTRLQLDFNKNQLVEKLRRLKKKYRNIANKKEYAFKTPHEQATFDLSRRIWGASVFARDDEEEDEPPAAAPPPPAERRRGKARPPAAMAEAAALKEMLYSAVGGPLGHLQPVPLGNPAMDDKWRKQQILELEVYSKRIELVQDQVKIILEELRKG
ncbi:putative transcription factor At5g28040 [Wolffia australiana]